VIDKFGLLLLVLTSSTVNHHQTHQDISHYLGIILILVGTLIVMGAQYNHQAYVLCLPAEDLPKQAIVRLDWFLTFSIATIGVLLTIYLVVA
jgi:putative membrane protein